MRSRVSLFLLLNVCYSATVNALPASRTLPDPSVRVRADTQFVTIYGLYDNSLHTPSLDTSKPKLAPITEAFKAMTRALATATVTGSGSEHSATPTPTPLHRMSPPSLGLGLVVRPTPVHSSIASTSTDVPPDVLQRAAQIRTHRLVVFGSVIAGVAFLGLLLFFLLDPRMMRKFCGNKANNNLPTPTSTRFYGAWDAPPISSSDFVFKTDTAINEKAFFTKKDHSDVIIDILPKQPVSKFSVCSSEYPPSLESDSYDTTENETSPVRPPRPPTADSPASLTESVYLACADQPYIIVAPQPFMGTDLGLDTPPATPKMLSPSEFFDMYTVHPDHTQLNATTREFNDTRHSRTQSAPLFGGSMNDETGDIPESIVAQRMLKHRRSRSASGWAYPDRSPTKGLHDQPYFSSGRDRINPIS